MTCGLPPVSVSASLVRVIPDSIVGRYLYLTNATYKCDVGTKLEDGFTSGKAACISLDSWSRDEIVCKGIYFRKES